MPLATALRPLPCGPRRVLLLGASGTIGRATLQALLRDGHTVVCLARAGSPASLGDACSTGAAWRRVDLQDAASVSREGLRGEPFDAVVSCMASRTGTPSDAWAVDHRAHLQVLQAAMAAGVPQMVLLSAICVQKPQLAFQQAKLAFERALIESGLTYSIVRPTAFFKSLVGQIGRVQRGKPFVLFGDGRQTACKPISDTDLADFIVRCLQDASRHNRILPIGGPGPAITPREQGERLFALLGRQPRFTELPLALMDAVVGALSLLGRVLPPLRDKAELARIGRYYATESMLWLDPASGRYDADATPSTGSQTLFDHYADILGGRAQVERGAHSVF